MEKEIFRLGARRIKILITKALKPPMATPLHSMGDRDSFKGGPDKTLRVPRSLASHQGWKTDPEIVAEIDRLLAHHTNGQVASILNKKEVTSGTGKAFHGMRISKTHRAYSLKSRYERLRDRGLLTRKELACKQQIHQNTITKKTSGSAY